MDVLALILRLVHVLDGAFWFGATLLLVGFVEPLAAKDPTGRQFMGRLMGQQLPLAMTVTSGLTLISGLSLYIKDSAGFNPAWMLTGPGIAFLLGGLAGLTAFGVGFFLIRPATIELQRRGGSDPELAGALGRYSLANAVLLTVAVAAMAIARTLG